MNSQVNELISQAEKVILCDKNNQIEDFFRSLEAYMKNFDAWLECLSDINPLSDESTLSLDDKASFRTCLEKLNSLHNQVFKIADLKKSDVAKEIRDLHKRGIALKTYVDQYPKRITIAGKREG